MRKPPTPGWQALFDTLNEGLGYAYLHSIGCTNIAFLPRADKRTPDLAANPGALRVLCEVKTINVLKDEADRRERTRQGEFKAFSVPTGVTEGWTLSFFAASTRSHSLMMLSRSKTERVLCPVICLSYQQDPSAFDTAIVVLVARSNRLEDLRARCLHFSKSFQPLHVAP